MSTNAIGAATERSLTARAAIAIVRSATAARARWLEQRAAELLPVEYFHVVFTLPQRLAPLALQNQQLIMASCSAPPPKP